MGWTNLNTNDGGAEMEYLRNCNAAAYSGPRLFITSLLRRVPRG